MSIELMADSQPYPENPRQPEAAVLNWAADSIECVVTLGPDKIIRCRSFYYWTGNRDLAQELAAVWNKHLEAARKENAGHGYAVSP